MKSNRIRPLAIGKISTHPSCFVRTYIVYIRMYVIEWDCPSRMLEKSSNKCRWSIQHEHRSLRVCITSCIITSRVCTWRMCTRGYICTYECAQNLYATYSEHAYCTVCTGFSLLSANALGVRPKQKQSVRVRKSI